MKDEKRLSTFECKYLVGDDSCRAIKEGEMGALRAEACHNEIKDTCCYLCGLRRNCDIGCDLPKQERMRKDVQLPKGIATSHERLEVECGNCVYYLKPKCPRGYSLDAELWRSQSPCEIFLPNKNSSKTS